MDSFSIALILAILLAATGIASLRFGIRSAALAIIIFTLTILPRAIPGIVDLDPRHVGIARSAPALMTYTIPILLAAILFVRSRHVRPVPIFAVAGYSLLWILLSWDSPKTVSGAILWCMAVISFAVGTSFGDRNQPGREMWESRAVLFLTTVFVAQAVVAVLQIAGSSVFAVDAATAELTAGRVNGTFHHTSALGKMVLIGYLVLLPATKSARKATARIAWIGICLGALLTLATESRANIVGVAGFLALWAAFSPAAKGLPRRAALFVAAGAITAAATPVVAARFEADPNGGARERLTDAALRGIPDNWLFGVGPNTYVDAFAQYDPLVGMGWPVHNAVLLVIAELGLVGLLLLATLIMSLCWSALATAGSGDLTRSTYARAFLIGLIAMAPMVLTGWGTLHDATLPWLFFALGWVSGAIQPLNQPNGFESADHAETHLERYSSLRAPSSTRAARSQASTQSTADPSAGTNPAYPLPRSSRRNG